MRDFDYLERSSMVLKLKTEDGRNFTLNELLFVLNSTKKAISEYYKKYYGIVNKEELEKLSPEIISARDGCIQIDTLVYGIVSGLLTELLIRIIKNSGVIDCVEDRITIMLTREDNEDYSPDEEFLICDATIKEYVINSLNTPLDVFARNIRIKHSISSIKQKVKATILLLNAHPIIHTAPFKGAGIITKSHRQQFDKACTINHI